MENLQYNAYIDFKTKINRFKSLNEEEEIELFKRYRQNDIDAKENIVNANLKYAVSIAEKHVKKKCNSEYYINNIADYVQQSIEGLVYALDRYDEESEVSFRTYAAYWIKKKLYAYDRHYIPFYISERRYRQIKRLISFEQAYIYTHFSEPNDFEIAKHMGISESDVRSLKQYRDRVQNDLLTEEEWESASYVDVYPGLEQMEESCEIREILNRLQTIGASELDIRIVKEILGEKHELSNIEISRRIKCPISTVKYHLRKLRPQFQDLMASH